MLPTDLPPATFVRGPTLRPVVVALTLATVGALALVALVASHGSVVGYAVTVLLPFGLYQAAANRRVYTAIGPGWVYTRTEALGGGHAIRLSGTTRVTRSVRSKGPDVLLVQAPDGTRLRFSLADTTQTTDLRAHLAQQLLASQATVEDGLRPLLEAWAAKTHPT